MAGGAADKALGGNLQGNLLILGAALSASLYTVVARRLLTTYNAVAVTRLQSLYASLMYLPFAALDWIQGAGAPGGHSLKGWSALLYLAIGCSFLAYWMMNYALSQVKASIVAAFTNVIPVVGSILAVVLLRERIYPLQGVGAVVILTCTTLLALRRPAAEPPSAAG
jgi:drug/metabolite transporter (DMT)-like permease